MKTYSEAAVAYAKSRSHSGCFRPGSLSANCSEAEAYDLVVAYLGITPPDEISFTGNCRVVDPRWKTGARGRYVFTDGTVIDGIVDERGEYLNYASDRYGTTAYTTPAHIYLLEEAPDPDKDRRAALIEVLSAANPAARFGETFAQKTIDGLREKGWTV